ncbi:MAG: radical SAM protein [Luteitalea sp.]|nr:radical SAM protein [Luteitalea sp.]
MSGARVRSVVRVWRRANRIARGARLIASGLVHTAHPLLAQVVVTRRCNLDCTYCNEFDTVSAPVPLSLLLHRLDKLAALGTSAVACTGGEPLLHPDLDAFIHGVRTRGMTSAVLTNGYLLSPKRIDALNRAGLDYLQISIDNVEPDAVSKKSQRLLDRKLQWLAEHALFDVHINSVLGAGVPRPEDAYTITLRARELGFSTSVGIIHDGAGHLRPLGPKERSVYEAIDREARDVPCYFKNLYSGLRRHERNLVDGRPNRWRCRAGARYLYICEDGLVHYCSQQRGAPGVPLDAYSVSDIRREFLTPKPCAPYCTIGCVHRVSVMDFWRAPQVSPRAD